MLPDALYVMGHWGFSYVTGFPWVKTTPSTGEIRRGVGFWTMGASEFVLIGRRGKPKTNREGTPIGLLEGEERVFYAPRGKRHSEKPLGIHEYLEKRLSGPYLELFARQEREGWTCLGDELGVTLEAR